MKIALKCTALLAKIGKTSGAYFYGDDFVFLTFKLETLKGIFSSIWRYKYEKRYEKINIQLHLISVYRGLIIFFLEIYPRKVLILKASVSSIFIGFKKT